MAKGRPNTWRAPAEQYRCTAETRSGERCKGPKQLGQNVCFFHTPKAKLASRKGGEATAASWKKVEAACKRLPLLKPQNQAKYLVYLLDREERGKHRWPAICKFLELLHKVTVSSGGADRVIHVIYEGRKPQPDGPEPAPLPSFQEVTE